MSCVLCRTQLRSVAEQLAGQHARILSYQQAAGAGSSVSQVTSSSQQMRSEKIAEQQLRIKQVNLDIQQIGLFVCYVRPLYIAFGFYNSCMHGCMGEVRCIDTRTKPFKSPFC